MNRAQAFAPASIANVAVGFDLLGFSIGVAGDTVLVERTGTPEVKLESISGIVTKIPVDAKTNTATAGLIKLRADLKLEFGFKVSIEKGIPLGSGMGGSAASAVAAIVAANALLEKPLSKDQLIKYALIGESKASGSFHADNIAPALYGGLTLARLRGNSAQPDVEVLSLPIPKDLYCVLINPSLSIETKTARGILKQDVSLKSHIEQSANLAGFIAGCYRDDLDLIARSLRDVVIEPQRAHLIPGFKDVQNAALAAGALGCSIAGAGPSVFALAKGAATAEKIKTVMVAAFEKNGVRAQGWASELKSDGARVTK